MLGAFVFPHPPLILPEVGRGGEKKIQKTVDACRAAARSIAALAPDTLIVASPHAALYADYFHISPGARYAGDMGRFRAREVRVEGRYDEELARAIGEKARASGIPAGFEGEREKALDHATLLPLHFVNEVYADYRLVRVGLSGLSPLTQYRFGSCIENAAQALGRRAVFIASGDLSHRLLAQGPYGFAPEGLVFDERVTRALGAGDFLSLLEIDADMAEAAGECGLRAFQIMAGALDGRAVESELRSYEGPYGVGYAVAAFKPGEAAPNRDFGDQYEARRRAEAERARAGEDAYVSLARQSLETYVRTGRRMAVPDGLPPELTKRRAGAFVSLKKHGALRGCIGTIAPTRETLAEEILRNAVSAGAEDPRFPPVTESELSELTVSVDVLGAPEIISGPEALDPKRYGVIVSRGGRRGLLLPDLPGVDTAQKQIAIARQKAGIPEGAQVQLSRFEVVRHT